MWVGVFGLVFGRGEFGRIGVEVGGRDEADM